MDERAKEVCCLETTIANVSNLVSLEKQLDFLTSKISKKRCDSRINRWIKRIDYPRRQTIRQIKNQLTSLRVELKDAKQQLEESQEICRRVQDEIKVRKRQDGFLPNCPIFHDTNVRYESLNRANSDYSDEEKLDDIKRLQQAVLAKWTLLFPIRNGC